MKNLQMTSFLTAIKLALILKCYLLRHSHHTKRKVLWVTKRAKRDWQFLWHQLLQEVMRWKLLLSENWLSQEPLKLFVYRLYQLHIKAKKVLGWHKRYLKTGFTPILFQKLKNSWKKEIYLSKPLDALLQVSTQIMIN